ncbi:MAG: phosphotriesterase [Candidatus Wallbacteria bacterium]|nr:phosphotriesterase [Candidatus Wallbacteria bacterium]
MNSIQTVTGTCAPAALGKTLMHEHLLVGWGGWDFDWPAPKFDRAAAKSYCVTRLAELMDLGVQTFVDPCPMDIGRDVTFMAEVSEATGMKIVCATGLYKEDLGNGSYFKQRPIEDIVELYLHELRVGIGTTGVRAGLIKCATGLGKVTAYEETLLRAASRAHRLTGVPITTHTDGGTMGKEQLDILASEGVDLRNVIVGHSCGASDLRVHTEMLDRGATLGFDRFGLEFFHPDKLRLAALIGLLGVGYERQLVLSHDFVQCWAGRFPHVPPEALKLVENWSATHLFRNIIPKLLAAGVAQKTIDTMLIDNPRDFFSRSEPAAAA